MNTTFRGRSGWMIPLILVTLCSAHAASAQTTGRSGPVSRLTTFGLFPPQLHARGYVPGQRKVHRQTTVRQGPETMIPLPQDVELPSHADQMTTTAMCTADACTGCDDDGCTATCASGGCGSCSCPMCCWIQIPIPTLPLDCVEVFGGVQGFTGPTNRGSTGSFGFHEGANWGFAFPGGPCGQLGSQIGFRATHSNFSGADFTDDNRNQLFLTGGVFRRCDYGVQCGLVLDYLHDDWYFNGDIVQLRGEVSWVYPCRHELGFWFNAGTNRDTVPTVTLTDGVQNEVFQATDIYAFFYRHRFNECGANGRVFAGFSGESDALIGANFRLPLSDRAALDAGFSYLLPEEATGAGGNIGESWNIGLSLVWYPGRRTAYGHDHTRPLFGVADNGSMFVDRN